ncbi:MAG: glycogen synthase GlgA [candidate division KSB1 bacterium]|nr:glycogen synthase GlgA [candidate division KSB1 bacterium]
MKNRLRILMLSSEVTPFAKTGGLADVAGALPKKLHDKGHDIRVIMPRYGGISERKFVLRDVIRLKKIPIKMCGKEYTVSAKSAFLPDSKVQVYLLEHKPFFGRKDLYVDPQTGKAFSDNPERFMLFCRAVIEMMRILHWKPQVIHCNDWQTALLPWFLKHQNLDDGFFDDTSTLLSIHNMAYQGDFSTDALTKSGCMNDLSPDDDLIKYDKINFLRAGLVTADAISTVSPTYAGEILDNQESAAGLQEELLQRKNDLYGILNGVDYNVWDPKTDPLIDANYDVDSLDQKSENKKALLKEAKLPYDENTILVGIISRLAEQKGFDIISEAIDDMLKMNLQIVVLGTGDPMYHKFWQDMMKKYPQKIAAFLTFDETLAHKIEASSDVFLMPSRFEPSGLNQLYSLRYGTVPVVRKTGGLADTITDFVQNPETGNGFVFTDYDSKSMLSALQNAVKTYSDRKTWVTLQLRGMQADYSWKAAAENYLQLYQDMIEKKNS